MWKYINKFYKKTLNTLSTSPGIYWLDKNWVGSSLGTWKITIYLGSTGILRFTALINRSWEPLSIFLICPRSVDKVMNKTDKVPHTLVGQMGNKQIHIRMCNISLLWKFQAWYLLRQPSIWVIWPTDLSFNYLLII